ncbi:MAG: lytic transglycosylase domain-containing protein, partial [Caldimonas sp.]
MTTADRIDPVYESRQRRCLRRARVVQALAMAAALIVSAVLLPGRAIAQGTGSTVLDARDAFRRHDRVRLAALRDQAAAERNPLAMWVDYWELTNRIGDVQAPEFAAFAQRWSGTYVEDRLRNDWLLELVRRRDRATFAAEYPSFRMNDDREVTCFAIANEVLAGKDMHGAGLAAWLAQKDGDDGCAFLATTMFDARQLSAADVWTKIRASIEAGRPRAARQAAGVLSDRIGSAVAEVLDSPARYLAKKASAATRTDAELTTIALARLATTDNESTAALMTRRWERALPGGLASYAWMSIARQTALKLQPEAADQFLRAGRVLGKSGREIAPSDDVLAWRARAALRADNGRPRWQQVVQAINAMSRPEQWEAAWVYWKAHALQAIAANSQDGAELVAGSRDLLVSIADQ